MNKENNTLVILTPGFPESEQDTTCLPLQQNFILGLKENYPQLNIIVLSFHYPYHKKTYKWFGITVTGFGGRNKGGLTRLLLRQKAYSALKKINRDNKLCGILSFWYHECAWVGKKFADKNHISHRCWILGQDAKQTNKYPRRLAANANELIALSDFIQDEFEKNHGVRPRHIIPPAINNIPLLEVDKDIDIIAAGSLIPLKQYEVFVEAIAEIKKEYPQVKAMLIGNGPEKQKLQTLISEKGLNQNIRLTGELPHPEVLQLMQRGKIFLHPSTYEGFGVVLLEALYSGCHAISFCRPMKQEISQWHIVKDKEAMIQKTKTLLGNAALPHKSIIPFLMDDTVKKIMLTLQT